MPMVDTSTRQPERIDYAWVDQQPTLDDVLETLLDVDRYALDTEFHRERTYFPKLALIQVAWLDAGAPGGQRVALIDPLTVDMTAFVPLFESDSLCVIHAAQQDLDVLTHAVGAVPSKMFDTQIAAGFAGYGTPSLVSLLQGEVGVSPPKGDRLTDWLRRPLSDDQMQYAAIRRGVPARGARPARRQAAKRAGGRSGSPTPARNCGRSRSAAPTPTTRGCG